MADLPDEVSAVTRDLLAAYDRHLPGGIAGFYLVGSLALGDYRPGRSDIDFVAIVEPGISPEILARLHADLARRHRHIHCDGIYVTRDDLRLPPAGKGIAAREGKVSALSADERHPATWMILRDHGIALRGPEPGPHWIAADAADLAAYSRANLQSYWRSWVEKRRALASLPGALLLGDAAIIWGVLGIPRLHAAIHAGQILSKSGAGPYALTAFPGHAPIVEEALALRSGGRTRYGSCLARRRDALAFMDAVLSTEA